MDTFASHIQEAFSSVKGAETGKLRKAIRASEVRAIWANLVEDHFLQHTNGVYIFKEDKRTIMRVYMDESIYAAELNNRRELIMLLCQERYGEAIDEFQIYIARGMMKKRYPYRAEKQNEVDQNNPVSLTTQEYNLVEQKVTTIENAALREKFKEAMIADLEWKKGNPQ